jgi:hypothetical protein
MTSTPAPRLAPTPDVRDRIVELAARAPSVHNTQPWVWRAYDDVIELWADRARQLTVADPDGRNLMISCGAALQHTEEAARVLGWESSIERLPDSREPDLVAVLHLTRNIPPDDAGERVRAIESRCTDRRRFTSWPIPDERLEHLASRARGLGAAVLPLVDVTLRFRVELLVGRAQLIQARDQEVAAEERRWIDHSNHDGVPAQVLPDLQGERGEHGTRYDDGPLVAAPPTVLESSDGLLVIGTAHDDPIAWLHAGEALSTMWLQATVDGLSVVPLTQVIEVGTTRESLRQDVLAGVLHPQVLVRLGWQEIGRSSLARTPRRPVEELLRD